MAHKKQGHLTTSPEWAKHLRKFMKTQYWRGERNAGKNLIRKEIEACDDLVIEPIVIWVDFNATSDNGYRLNCKGTIEDLKKQKISLVSGMKLLLWDEDFDEDGNRDNLIIEAVAQYNSEEGYWEGVFEKREVMHESELLRLKLMRN